MLVRARTNPACPYLNAQSNFSALPPHPNSSASKVSNGYSDLLQRQPTTTPAHTTTSHQAKVSNGNHSPQTSASNSQQPPRILASKHQTPSQQPRQPQQRRCLRCLHNTTQPQSAQPAAPIDGYTPSPQPNTKRVDTTEKRTAATTTTQVTKSHQANYGTTTTPAQPAKIQTSKATKEAIRQELTQLTQQQAMSGNKQRQGSPIL